TGIAGLGAIFQHSVTKSTTAALNTSGHAREVQAAAHGKLSALLGSGEVTQVAKHLHPAARTALLHSYRVGFTHAFDSIALIAALIALVGGALAFALVRGRDFVASAPPQAPREPVQADVATV
ncbi:MAG TPA: hypothetical protein VK765_05000, partial [Solirubrobacteraceae bacterium]|nr:hypothetical protein [Solirubrobacteraceae bacterium]